MPRLNLNRNRVLVIPLTTVLLLAATFLTLPPEQPRAAGDVRISIEQFGRFIDEWSEPEGYFDSDNFISNETSYLHVIPELKKKVPPGAVYIGVGPDQNFSYIVHTQPSFAVIADIRRQNALQHLLFKALFDMAANRVQYLALLFSREPPQAGPDASLDSILQALRAAPTNRDRFTQNLEAIQALLVHGYKLKLSSGDLDKIEYMYRTFWSENLDLRFSSIGRPSYQRYPRFEELLLETDREGHLQNYVSSEHLFQWLKRFQKENRLIPVVGDFAGPKAFKAVAQFLKQNGLTVSAFYTSNVEFYLFGRPAWDRYMANLREFPIARESVMIRAYFGNYGRLHPRNVPGHRSTSLVHSMPDFIRDYDAGRISSYWEVVRR